MTRPAGRAGKRKGGGESPPLWRRRSHPQGWRGIAGLKGPWHGSAIKGGLDTLIGDAV